MIQMENLFLNTDNNENSFRHIPYLITYDLFFLRYARS